jgi:cytochrome b6-f complex iron-sulfur subunit
MTGTSTSEVDRRGVVVALGVGALSALSGFAATALAYLWPRGGAAASDWLTGADGPVRVDDIGPDGSVVGRSALGKILVVRRHGQLTGLQATCTHLGCTVAWDAASGDVVCPCHGARYNLSGKVLAGPAREPLRPVSLLVEPDGIRVRPASDG